MRHDQLPADASPVSVSQAGLIRLSGPAFSERMIELYNDHFLTDKYLGRENAIELLDEFAGAWTRCLRAAGVPGRSLAQRP